MKFIRVPMSIAKTTEIEEAEIANIEPEWKDGFGIVNLDEIESIAGGESDCTVFFKSGNTTGVNLMIDDFATLLDSK